MKKQPVAGMLVNTASVEITIHMAGAIETAKVTLRRFCYEVGRCVTISPETFSSRRIRSPCRRSPCKRPLFH